MRKLSFDYSMKIHYSDPAGIGHFTIKCIPMNTARQQLLDYRMEIEPEHTESTGMDSFGNHQVYGVIPKEHDFFSYRITGSVVCQSEAFFEEIADESNAVLFRYPHGLNKAGEHIRSYYQELSGELAEAKSDYEAGLILMHSLFARMIYSKGVTAVNTSAEQAWSQGQGVCQDYAHIFIALAHLHGMAARYVTGLIEGEGASHAWAELLCDGKWYGFDPTNDMVVEDRHIKIGHGRDAMDCQVNRGIMKGGGMQTQTIFVSVNEESK